MKRLFVIGNGFDAAHGLNTQYSNFRKWLIESVYGKELEDDMFYDFSVPCYDTNYKGYEEYDKSAFAEFFVRLVDDASVDGDEWRYYEETLGKLRWQLVLDNVNEQYDKEGDIDPWATDEALTSLASECAETSHILTSLFTEWARGINDELDYHEPRDEFKKKLCIGDNDIFFSFNYTDTLEKLYGIQNVVHLHGRASEYEELIVGHGQESFEYDYEDPVYDNSYDVLSRIFESYRKDTRSVIEAHKKDFEEIRDVDKIYIYGFSFGDVDKVYFQEIFKECKARELILYVHCDEEYESKEQIVRELGFEGTILNWKRVVV